MNDQQSPNMNPLAAATAVIVVISAPFVYWLTKIGFKIFAMATGLLILALIGFTILMIIRNRSGE